MGAHRTTTATTASTATAALLLALLPGCSGDVDAPGPASADRPWAPTSSLPVLPRPTGGAAGAEIPSGVVARFLGASGTLCTGPQGRPSPPSGTRVDDRAGDLRLVGGSTVRRELTLYADADAARAWVRRLRVEGPCVRIDGLRVSTSELTALAPDPRVGPRLPAGTLLRSQVLRTDGATDPVLLVDVVSRRGEVVLWSQVMELSARPGADDLPLAGRGTERVVRRVEAEARDNARLLDRFGRAADRR